MVLLLVAQRVVRLNRPGAIVRSQGKVTVHDTGTAINIIEWPPLSEECVRSGNGLVPLVKPRIRQREGVSVFSGCSSQLLQVTPDECYHWSSWSMSLEPVANETEGLLGNIMPCTPKS